MISDFRQGYQEFELSNGLRVALQRTSTKTVAGRLKVDFGTIHEQPDERGLAHFLEHVVPCGGSDKFSPEQQDEIDKTFGYSNAQTGINYTQFPVDMVPGDMNLYLEFISDSVFGPRFDPKIVERERNRILREFAERSGQTLKDFEDLNRAVFRQDVYSTYFVIGSEKIVSQATLNDLRGLHSRGYGASNMNLILVGDLPPDAEDVVRQYFENQITGTRFDITCPQVSPLKESLVLHRYAPDILNKANPRESNSDVNIVMLATNMSDPDSYAIRTMTSVLSQRLFRTVSKEAGLAYSAGSYYNLNPDYGTLDIRANVASLRQQEAIDLIFKEMKKMQEDLVDQKELERVKKDAVYNLSKRFETNDGHVDSIERWLYKRETPEQFLNLMSAVGPEDIRRVASAYLPRSRSDSRYVMLIRDPLLEAA